MQLRSPEELPSNSHGFHTTWLCPSDRRRVSRGIAPHLRPTVASRELARLRRSRPTRAEFGAVFTDIAAQAGLVRPVLYGEEDHKDYILETVGCGCAFFDYDNDGWMDIFVLNGNRLRGVPQGTTSRLYRNNRDGTLPT